MNKKPLSYFISLFILLWSFRDDPINYIIIIIPAYLFPTPGRQSALSLVVL